MSPDGRILITGSTEGYLTEWDAASGEKRRVLLDPKREEDENPEIVLIENGVETELPFKIARLSECMRGSSIMAVRFSPDGSMLAVGAANGAVVLWNAKSRGEIHYWADHKDRIDALAFSPDNRWVAAGSLEEGVESLRVWQIKSKRPFEAIEAFADDSHFGGVSSLCFSPDSLVLAAGCFTVSGYTGPALYEVKTGRRFGWFDYDLTRGLDFSPDGKLLVTGDDFGTVTFWDVETNKPQFSEEAHTRPVGSVLFSRDGRMLATGSWDGSVRVWDVAEKKSLANYATGAIVFTMRFAADDRSLIVASTKEDSHEPDMFYFP